MILLKRVRLAAVALLIFSVAKLLCSMFYTVFPAQEHAIATTISATGEAFNWSRFAYVQYATDTEYICNSVMLFEALHRLGSKADRLLMYPYKLWHNTQAAGLLIHARDKYNAKLVPISLLHRESADSMSLNISFSSSHANVDVLRRNLGRFFHEATCL